MSDDDTLRIRVAKAIYAERPDVKGREWNEYNPTAAMHLSMAYADAALRTAQVDPAPFIARLKEWQGPTDTEAAHSEADGILCDLLIALGYASVVEEWAKVDKWYA